MGKSLIAALLCAGALYANTSATVTRVDFDNISYSATRVRITLNANYTGLRLRYSQLPTSCADGNSGTVQGTSTYGPYGTSWNIAGNLDGFNNSPAFLNLSGLTVGNPGNSYMVCPEVSNDYGGSWHVGATGTVQLLSFPGDQAFQPHLPRAFTVQYPTDYADMLANHTVASSCANWQADLQTAWGQSMSHGTIITIPAGSACTAGNWYLDDNTYRLDLDVKEFNSSGVSVPNSTITLPSGHGFVEGDAMSLGVRKNYGAENCIPGSLTTNPILNEIAKCSESGPLMPGSTYYVHFPNFASAPNVVQLYKYAPYNQIDPITGNQGKLSKFEDVGSNKTWFAPWPRKVHQIIIRTSTPDSQFTPFGVRTGPAWASKMVQFVQTRYEYGLPDSHNFLMYVGALEGGDMSILANLMFIGIEFTHSDFPSSHASTDPPVPGLLLATNAVNQNIWFDRCWFHGLGSPHRMYQFLAWEGKNAAIVNSYIDGMEFWHGTRFGFAISGH